MADQKYPNVKGVIVPKLTESKRVALCQGIALSILKIEAAFPGWWYSIRLERDNANIVITCSLGPSDCVPYVGNAELLDIRRFDSGFILESTVSIESFKLASVLNTITNVMSVAHYERQSVMNNPSGRIIAKLADALSGKSVSDTNLLKALSPEPPPSKPRGGWTHNILELPRRHNSRDVHSIEEHLNKLFLMPIWDRIGMTVLSVGSCFRSADVTVVTAEDNNTDTPELLVFDVDLSEKRCRIGNSLAQVMSDLHGQFISPCSSTE